MRRLPVAGLVAMLAASIATVSPCDAQAPAEATAQLLRELLESIPGEIAVARQIFEADLAAGAARKVWTEEEHLFELERVRALIEGPQLPLRRAPAAIGRREALMTRLLRPLDPVPITTPAARWIGDRLVALELLRTSAAACFRQLAIVRAEEIWLAARRLEDLEPARALLAEAHAILPSPYAATSRVNRIWGGRPVTFHGPGGIERRSAPAQLVDYLSVVASSEPLFLPDPGADAVAFARARLYWGLLQQIEHPFVRSPRLAARFAELEARFQAICQAELRSLDGAILHDLPAAEFERAWSRVVPLLDPRLPERHPPPVSPLSGVELDDFLDWIAPGRMELQRQQESAERQAGAAPQIQLRRLMPEIGGDAEEGLAESEITQPLIYSPYPLWLRFLQATEAADRDHVRTTRESLHAMHDRFHPEVAAHLRRRLEETAASAPRAVAAPGAPAPAGDAVAALISALRDYDSTARADQEPHGIGELAVPWLAVERSQPLEEHSQAPVTREGWARLAALIKHRPLLLHRENAGRELLGKITGTTAPTVSPQAPMPALLRQAIDDAVAQDRLEIAQRLLDLDSAGVFLLPAEHERHALEITVLRRARESTAEGDPAAAHEALRQLLSFTVSHSTAAAAARDLQHLAVAAKASRKR